MAKLVDALPSGGSVRKDVQVRILFWALGTNKTPDSSSYQGFSIYKVKLKGFLPTKYMQS
jgi:hypothetical protein